jgi:hypothetical protein
MIIIFLHHYLPNIIYVKYFLLLKYFSQKQIHPKKKMNTVALKVLEEASLYGVG